MHERRIGQVINACHPAKPHCRPKIFGIGLSRTGTSSLARAMKLFGFSTKHGPSYMDEVCRYDFLNDIFIASRYRFFDEVFPKAKFILTIRDIETWLESCDRYLRQRRRQPLRRLESRFLCYGCIRFDSEKFRQAYERHVQDVQAHFRGRYEKLLVMNICNGDGWEKLCPFVDRPLPNVPFPHAHKSRRRSDREGENH